MYDITYQCDDIKMIQYQWDMILMLNLRTDSTKTLIALTCVQEMNASPKLTLSHLVKGPCNKTKPQTHLMLQTYLGTLTCTHTNHFAAQTWNYLSTDIGEIIEFSVIIQEKFKDISVPKIIFFSVLDCIPLR